VERVKISAMAIFCVLIACVAHAVVKVEPIVPVECSRNIRITVALKGKTVSSVKLDFYDGANNSSLQPVFSARTNKAGIVNTPMLALNSYRVDARLHGRTPAILGGDITSSIWLQVIPKSKVRAISIDLTEAEQVAQETRKQFEDRLTEADQGQRARLRVFEGRLVDLTGANISSVEVTVLRKTSHGWASRLSAISDAEGNFSTKKLSKGQYIAIFSSAGFRLEMVPFEVTTEGSEKLRVTLQIGFTDTGVPRDSSRIAATGNWQLIPDH
jgi:hypothetical protein